MAKALLALLLCAPAHWLLAQGAPPQTAPDQPYSMEYYYKVQWGHQQEFLQLFSQGPLSPPSKTKSRAVACHR